MGIYNPFVQLFPITWFMYSKLKYSCNELQFTAPFLKMSLICMKKIRAGPLFYSRTLADNIMFIFVNFRDLLEYNVFVLFKVINQIQDGFI